MNLKKTKRTSALFLCLWLIIAQLPVFSVGYPINTDLVIKSESVASSEVVFSENILVDDYSDETNTPINLRKEEVITSEILKDGTCEVTFIKEGVIHTGRYLENNGVRRLHASELETYLFTYPADEMGTRLGFDRLYTEVESRTEEIIVAVIDSGVDPKHSLLEGRLVKGYDVIKNSATMTDTMGHGTHVAGIIATTTPKNVKIMPIKVFGDENALDSDIVEGIYYAVNNGAKIINMSLGGYGKTSYLEKGIQYARSHDVMVIVSSGNDAHNNEYDYPAAFNEVITVGATTGQDTLLYYSNTGTSVDICAPGEKILSLAPDESYKSLSGTSMSAPFVSAAAALIWLSQPQNKLAQVESALLDNTRDLGPAGKDIAFGKGIIDLTNYQSNEDFYLIGNFDEASDEPLEFKYDLPIKYYASDKVSQVSVKIDQSTVHTSTKNNGVYEMVVDIRKFSVNSHDITIEVAFKDGTNQTVVEESFIIPEYNVAAKYFDVNGASVATGNGLAGYMISHRDHTSFREFKEMKSSNDIAQMNIDFTREYEKKLTYYLNYRGGSRYIPTYLRAIFASGDYLLEPTESKAINYNTDLDNNSGYIVEYKLPIVLDLYGPNNPEFWTLYQTWAINYVWLNDLNVFDDDPGINFYYDIYDFNITITTDYIDRTDTTSRVVLYNGFASKIETDVSGAFDRGVLVTFDEALNHGNYSFTSVFTKDHIAIDGKLNEVYLPAGIYDFFTSVENRINDQTRIVYNYSNKIDLVSNDYMDINVDNTLKSEIWTGIFGCFIYNRWTDGSNNSITANLQKNGGTYEFIMPTMVLKNTKTGKIFEIQGRKELSNFNTPNEVFNSDSYSVEKIPDGTYEVTFKFDIAFEPYKISHPYTLVTIAGGNVKLGKNTPPQGYKTLNITIPALEEVAFDLENIFWDLEQSDLYFSSSKGIVLNNTLYYKDTTKRTPPLRFMLTTAFKEIRSVQ